MTLDQLAALTLFALATSVTPGPNVIMLLSSGLNYGVRRSLPHLAGICLGFPLMLVAVGLGLGALFERYPLLHSLIKTAGIVYLLYLAWRIAGAHVEFDGARRGRPLSFLQAALFQWVNPKAWILAVGGIAAYTSSAGDVTAQILIIALVFGLVGVPSAGVWLLFGSGLQNVFCNEQRQRAFNTAMAALLALSVLPMALL